MGNYKNGSNLQRNCVQMEAKIQFMDNWSLSMYIILYLMVGRASDPWRQWWETTRTGRIFREIVYRWKLKYNLWIIGVCPCTLYYTSWWVEPLICGGNGGKLQERVESSEKLCTDGSS